MNNPKQSGSSLKNTAFSKSKLSFIKNIKNFSSLLNASSSYWNNAVSNSFCSCSSREEFPSKSPPLPSNKHSIFKVTSQSHQLSFTKEWNKTELELLMSSYYKNKIKNWKRLSQIIQTKSPQQCCYKIKKYEEKAKMKDFSRQDEMKLIELVNKYGKDFNTISSFFPGYLPTSLEERYANKLDPKLKRSKFSEEEDERIITLYNKYGNNWKEISKCFPDRSANMIKNRFYSFLRKKYNIKSNASSYSNSAGSGNGSYVDTNCSIFMNYNELILEELNDNNEGLCFKYNDLPMIVENDNNSYGNMLLKEDNYDYNYQGNNNNNNNNNTSTEIIDETLQKIFPNQPHKDFSFDSGSSGNNIMIGPFKDSTNNNNNNSSHNDEDDKVISNSLNENDSLKQAEKLFYESQQLEDILEQINQMKLNDDNNRNLEGNNQYSDLLNNSKVMDDKQKELKQKLQKLKSECNILIQDNKPYIPVLIEINETLLQLINLSKVRLMNTKQINELNDIEMNMPS